MKIRRENQIFKGCFKDKELYLIEDALMYYKDHPDIIQKERKAIDKLILSLHKGFSEYPMKQEIKNGFANGDTVTIQGIIGMIELNGVTCIVANKTRINERRKKIKI